MLTKLILFTATTTAALIFGGFTSCRAATDPTAECKKAGMAVSFEGQGVTCLEDAGRGLIATCTNDGLAFITDSHNQKLYLVHRNGKVEVMDGYTGAIAHAPFPAF